MSQTEYIATHKVSDYTTGGQVNISNPDAIDALGVRPGDEIGLRENGVGLIVEPVDNGHKKRHTSSVYPITLTLSEFECRMLGNRLWELSDIYEGKSQISDHQIHELRWWARRFHDECNTRD